MSYALVDEIICQSSIRPADRWVLVVLASYCRNGSNECWPSVDKLTQRSGFSRRHILNALARLEAAGAIQVVRRHRRGNRYRVAWPS
jgi:DNA-binding transcriptional regulator PaaX